MTDMNELSNFLMHYGRVTSDISFTENVFDEVFNTRIRTFIYNGRHFYHAMCNGEVADCFELK